MISTRYLVFVVVIALVAGSFVGAQNQESFAFIIYAEGFDMSIYRNEELTTYDVLVDDVIGMPLLPGDLVQTDAGTFVEIQVMPSRTVIKVAENTTFEIEQIGGEGGGTFNMSYGRVRARVERLTRSDPFQIRGLTAVAGVRGTDFGYDLVVEREAAQELQTKVYVFEGEVDVTEPVRGAAPADDQTQAIRIGANEMVAVVTEVPDELAAAADAAITGEPIDPVAPSAVRPQVEQVVFERQTIERDIQEFWEEQAFREEPVDPGLVEEAFPGITARVQRLSEERARYEELQRLRREGLLTPTDELLAELGVEREEQREAEQIALGEPLPDERVRRILGPVDDLTISQQSIVAGHWLVGAGILLETVGAIVAWNDGSFDSGDDFAAGGPGQGLMAGGSVFITSGLVSYLFGLLSR